MRRTLTMLAAIAGTIVFTLLAASPAQATTGTTLSFWVNTDAGSVHFVGDPGPNDDRELLNVCDEDADDYGIVAYVDTDRDGFGDLVLRASGGNGSCTGVKAFNVPEERRMFIWACQYRGTTIENHCTSKITIYA